MTNLYVIKEQMCESHGSDWVYIVCSEEGEIVSDSISTESTHTIEEITQEKKYNAKYGEHGWKIIFIEDQETVTKDELLKISEQWYKNSANKSDR